MKLKLMIAAALAGSMALAASPSHAAVIVAAPGAAVPGVGYPAPVAVTQAGTAVTFVNLDPLSPHNVVSVRKKANGTPLFQSIFIAAGETAVVEGTANLAPGDYEYFCTPHQAYMTGTLTVV